MYMVLVTYEPVGTLWGVAQHFRSPFCWSNLRCFQILLSGTSHWLPSIGFLQFSIEYALNPISSGFPLKSSPCHAAKVCVSRAAGVRNSCPLNSTCGLVKVWMVYLISYFWLNQSNSLPWIKAISEWFPSLKSLFQGSVATWGRSNLPRSLGLPEDLRGTSSKICRMRNQLTYLELVGGRTIGYNSVLSGSGGIEMTWKNRMSTEWDPHSAAWTISSAERMLSDIVH